MKDNIELQQEFENLIDELEKLRPLVKHAEMVEEAIQVVRGIPQKHIDLINEIQEFDLKHKEILEKIFSNDLISLKNETNKNLNTTTELQSLVLEEISDLGKLKETIRDFYHRIGKIHLQQRLNNIESNLNEIITSVNSLQDSFDLIESKIAEQMNILSNTQNEILTKMYALNKRQQYFSIIILIFIFLGVVSVIIFS